MLNTIKPYPEDFNLLYLDYNEYIINTIKCYSFNANTKSIEVGKLHLNTRSLLIQPKDISIPMLKMKFSESLALKIISVEDIVNFHNTNTELSSHKDKQQTYLQRSSTYRKKSFNPTTSVNSNVNQFNFNTMLSTYQQQNDHNSTKLRKSGKYSSMASILNTNTNNNQNQNQNLPVNQVPSNINNTNANIGSSNNTNYFNVKFTNFGEMLNKVIKEGMGNQPIGILMKSVSGNQNHLLTNNTNTNSSTSSANLYNDLFSKNFKRNMTNNSVIDLLCFFQEHNLNFNNFCDFFSYLNSQFLKDEKFHLKYSFVIARVNRSNIIGRVPVSNYENIITPRTYLFILEGEDKHLKYFMEDRKFIMETLYKTNDDFYQFNLFVNKKISELNENIERAYLTNNLFDPNSVLQANSKSNDKSINIDKENNFLLSINFNTDSQILYKCKVIRKLPEGIQHGLFLILNNGTVEFRPVTNNYKGRILMFKLSRIKALVPYRYLFKNKAINILFYQSRRSKIFDFESEVEYKEIYDYLLENSGNIDKNFTDVKYHSNLWVNGQMSNYDYLLYLNIMGSRSFSDLSQYPIFPWIITNYSDDEEFDVADSNNYRDLSKPVGALNPEKFERFNKEFMLNKLNGGDSEPAFLYNRHYSSPAIVIFYLMRVLPQYQLQLQGGTIGYLERMFNNIKEFWQSNIYTHDLEVHELTPEFYGSDGEFLMNIHDIPLGKTQSNKSIDNVMLPKWAKTPQDFVYVCRAALESEYVSSHLHYWIDLIFGSKQRGEEAEKSYNIFNYLSYDNISYDDFPELKKQGYLNHIIECGQIPTQIFIEPHQKKRSINILNSQLLNNGQEEIKIRIDNLRKENEKLERSLKKMESEKHIEKEILIKEFKEIDKKRTEKIKKLKETLNDKEKYYKGIIEKMIDQNTNLKENFESYDGKKEDFYNHTIDNMKNSHQKYIDSKLSNQGQLFGYIKSLETSINKLKLKEEQDEEKVEELSISLEKYDKNNKRVEDQISALKQKLNNIK